MNRWTALLLGIVFVGLVGNTTLRADEPAADAQAPAADPHHHGHKHKPSGKKKVKKETTTKKETITETAPVEGAEEPKAN